MSSIFFESEVFSQVFLEKLDVTTQPLFFQQDFICGAKGAFNSK